MVRAVPVVLLVAALVSMSVPAAAQFQAPEESIFVWRAEGSEGTNPSGIGPQLCSVLFGEANPCDLRAYEMGNTDIHAYFRWTLETLEFAPQGQTAALYFEQAFRGSTGDVFSFAAIVNALDDVPIWTNATPTAWDSQIEWHLDRAAGTLTAQLPLELIATTLATGLFAMETFGILSDKLEVRMTPLYVPGVSSPPGGSSLGPLNSLWQAVDEIHRDDYPSGTYVLQPHGSLVFAPATIHREISGLPILEEVTFDRLNATTYVYAWDLPQSGFILSANAQIEGGAANLQIRNPANVTVFDGALTPTVIVETFEDVSRGEWTIEVRAEYVDGWARFALAPVPPPPVAPEAPTGEDGDDEETEAPTNGDESEGDVDADDRGMPAPGLLLFIAALAGLLAWRRRRA